jgi:hypothetical protein
MSNVDGVNASMTALRLALVARAASRIRQEDDGREVQFNTPADVI